MVRFAGLVLLSALSFGACHGGGSVAPSDGPTVLRDARSDQTLVDGPPTPLLWIDPHAHLKSEQKIASYVALADQLAIGEMYLQVAPKLRAFLDGTVGNYNPEALVARVRHPTRFRIFGGFDFLALSGKSAAEAQQELRRQAEELADLGVDGLKVYMKVTAVDIIKQGTGFDFVPDSALTQGIWEVAAARQLPILIHLDAPYHAAGVALLAKYPQIVWLVTHLGGVANDLAKVEKIAKAGANVYLDIGHFVHLGPLLAQPGGRDLLVNYADRIAAGTDNGSGCDLQNLPDDQCPTDILFTETTQTLRRLLETDEPVTWFDVYSQKQLTVAGAKLPADVLQKILRDNLLALFGPTARTLDRAKAAAHIDGLLANATDATDIARVQALRDEIAP